MNRIYLDNAATTPIAPEVLEAMIPVLSNTFGNPSSTHTFGRQAKALIVMARKKVAELLNCTPGEIIFTSGGTEADNMAIRCAVRDLGVKRIVTTPMEHHAVLHTAEHVADCHSGVTVHLLNVNKQGHIDLQELGAVLSDGVSTLVSIMHANNEIGTLSDIQAISRICREHKAYFHSDTVQTMGHYHFNLAELDVDFLTCAAHKLHGPKGVGFLYLNKRIRNLHQLITGGSQERDMRGGTENIYGIVGLAKALEIACEDVHGHQQYVQGLKNQMIALLREAIPGVEFNGDIRPEHSLYTVLNLNLPATTSKDTFLFMMDMQGVAASAGSACSSGSNKGSHVLAAIGADPLRIHVRFSFSRMNESVEIEEAVKVLAKILQPLSV
jgi:cysteine desulfurase